MKPELYADYLASEAWALRRDLVMARAGGRCEGCRLAAATEVHHLSYEHVTQEFLFELVALCGDCHDRVHAAPAPNRRAWAPRRTDLLNDAPRVRSDRQTLVELAAIHRRKWSALTDEERRTRIAALEQTAAVLAPAVVAQIARRDDPFDAIPE